MVTRTNWGPGARRALAALAALAPLLAEGRARADEGAPPPPAPVGVTKEAPPAGAPPAPPAHAAPAVVAPAAAEAPPSPRAHHAPVVSARQREAIAIVVVLVHPERVQRATVLYRTADGRSGSAPLLRSSGDGYVATIPADRVLAPSLSYTIEIEPVGGAPFAAFASRERMHSVQVLEDASDARERALLRRLGGKRSVVAASAEHVRFGETEPRTSIRCGAGQDRCAEGELLSPGSAAVDDQYYRIEAGYTYRPLGTVAEFSLRGGVIRGTSLVPSEEFDESRYKVGANYGAPTVRFRLADAWHLEAEFLTSITEVGFSVGFGGALLIGDPYGTRLTLAFETIGPGDDQAYFGSRFQSRVDIAASEAISIAPLIEVTDMPHAEEYGVRLLGEAGIALGGGFHAAVRGGYQARKSTSGGPSAGGTLSLAF
jgi:hypothetical protein